MDELSSQSEAVVRRVLVFGGTFDPPHRAHAVLPAQAALQLRCDDILYVPAALNPLKQEPTVTREHRLGMLLLALADVPEARICTLELDREGPSYTIDTLRALHAQYAAGNQSTARIAAGTATRTSASESSRSRSSSHSHSHRPTSRAGVAEHQQRFSQSPEFSLLIGCDQALDFHRWKQWQEILTLATPAVMVRPPWDESSFHQALTRTYSNVEAECWRRWTLRLPRMDMNSTEIRQQLRAGNFKAVEPMLQPAVLQYIRANHLYR